MTMSGFFYVSPYTIYVIISVQALRQQMYCEFSHFIECLEINQYKGRLFYNNLHNIYDKNLYISANYLSC